MQSNPLFRMLEEFEVKCFSCRLEEGSEFITKGKEADAVFILEDGELKAGTRTVGCRQLIGEQAVVYQSRRGATVRAVTGCNLIGILKEDFMEVTRMVSAKEKWFLYDLGLLKQFSTEVKD